MSPFQLLILPGGTAEPERLRVSISRLTAGQRQDRGKNAHPDSQVRALALRQCQRPGESGSTLQGGGGALESLRHSDAERGSGGQQN